MARIEDLISEIADARLRDRIAREVATLKKQKKFGLVFEEHIPEQVLLPGLPVKPGMRVVKRGKSIKEVYLVEKVHGNGKALIRRENDDGEEETAKTKDMVVIKRFGEPIYTTLTPVARLTRAEGKPYHTIINADNFHALQLLLYCYAGQVDVIYIDPPYNTGARDWKYNNDYVDAADQWRHSKWLSMMRKRLLIARMLLKPEGVLICTIDDYENFHVGCLLEELFPSYVIETLVVEHHPQGGGGQNLSRTHEYAIFCVPQDFPLKGNPVEEHEDEWSLQRAGTDMRNFRYGRPNQFYAVHLNPVRQEVVGVGPKLAPYDGYSTEPLPDGTVRVYPIDREGKERVWRYERETMKRKIEAREIICTERGTLKVRVDRAGKCAPIFSVWTGSRYAAGAHGTSLMADIIGTTAAFSYPKSVYNVFDCVASVVRDRPEALIVDFFAGSGTTYHATALLNANDGGNRRSILVTNNEVNEKQAEELNKDGHFPSDPEFEKHGICEAVTWPRCKFVTQGHRDDGTPLPGNYLDGGELKDGFKENLEYFRLDFLDPHEVAYGDSFEAILPILWLMAGAKGERETVRGRGKWFIPKNSPYAVLIREEHFAEFKRELVDRPDITLVLLVTDSEEAFREMLSDLPGRPHTKMLYKSYLDNFRINVEKAL